MFFLLRELRERDTMKITRDKKLKAALLGLIS